MSESLKNTGIAVVNEPVVKTGQKSIVVLGLANSGTSSIAGMLHALGIYMGDIANAPNTFEDQELIRLMEKKGNKKALRAVLRDRTKEHSVWGFNRPGSLRYLPKFSSLFPDPHYIAVFRDHTTIGLGNLDSEQPDLINNLRKAHRQLKRMVDFLIEGNRPTMLVSYEKMMQNPEHLLEKSIQFIGIEPSQNQRIEALKAFAVQTSPEYLELEFKGVWGVLEPIENNHVKGWVMERGSIDPVEVEILVDGKAVQQLMANKYRQGLEKRGIGKGEHAFFFDLSKLENLPEKAEIAVRTLKSQTVLSNSPRVWEKK